MLFSQLFFVNFVTNLDFTCILVNVLTSQGASIIDNSPGAFINDNFPLAFIIN